MKVKNLKTGVVEDVVDSQSLKSGIISGEMTPLETNRNYYIRATDGQMWNMPNYQKWAEAVKENPDVTPLLDIDIELERKKASSDFSDKAYTFVNGLINGIPFGEAIKNKAIDAAVNLGLSGDEGFTGRTSGLSKEQIATKAKEMSQVYKEANPISAGTGYVGGAIGSMILPAGGIAKGAAATSKAIPIIGSSKLATWGAEKALEGAAYSSINKASEIAEEITRTDRILPVLASHWTADTLKEILTGSVVNLGIAGAGTGIKKVAQELIPGMGGLKSTADIGFEKNTLKPTGKIRQALENLGSNVETSEGLEATLGNKFAAKLGFFGKREEVDKEVYKNLLARRQVNIEDALPARGEEAKSFDNWRDDIKKQLSGKGVWNPNTERAYMAGEGPAKVKFFTKTEDLGNIEKYKKELSDLTKQWDDRIKGQNPIITKQLEAEKRQAIEELYNKREPYFEKPLKEKLVNVPGPIGTATEKELSEVNSLFDRVFNDKVLAEYQKNNPIVKQKIDLAYDYFTRSDNIVDQIDTLKGILNEGGLTNVSPTTLNIAGKKISLGALAKIFGAGSSLLGGVSLFSSVPAYLATAPVHSPETYLKFLSVADNLMEKELTQSLINGAKTITKLSVNKGAMELARKFEQQDNYKKFQSSLDERISLTEKALIDDEKSPVSQEWQKVLDKMDEPTRNSILQLKLDSLNYLSQSAPKHRILDNGRVVPPTAKELVEYAKKVHAISNPSYLFSKIKNNIKLDNSEREILERFHPGVNQLWQEAQGAQIKLGDVPSMDKTSYLLNGKNRTSSSVFQITWQTPEENIEGKPSSSKNTPIGQGYQTSSQKLLMR